MTTATQDEAIAAYRDARAAWIAACEKADAAFLRWFAKAQAGKSTNGAQASRLANEANYLSADLSTAQGRLWKLDLDPHQIDDEDGVEQTPLGGSAFS